MQFVWTILTYAGIRDDVQNFIIKTWSNLITFNGFSGSAKYDKLGNSLLFKSNASVRRIIKIIHDTQWEKYQKMYRKNLFCFFFYIYNILNAMREERKKKNINTNCVQREKVADEEYLSSFRSMS